MTSTQYLMGWAVYLLGATGCLLALWLITRKLSPRFRRTLRLALAALLYTPWWLTADSQLLSPAFFTTIYDVLSNGSESAARAGIVSGAAFVAAVLLGIILPVQSLPEVTKKQVKPRSAAGPKAVRQEPTC